MLGQYTVTVVLLIMFLPRLTHGWGCPDSIVADPTWKTQLSGYDIIDQCSIPGGVTLTNTTNDCSGSCPHAGHGGTCQPAQPVMTSGANLHCNISCDLQLGPLRQLHPNTFWALNIFTGNPFLCNTKVTAWEFWAEHTGDAYFDVWRLGADNKWELIGKNKYTASSTGLHVFAVPSVDQIPVLVGDAIGVHYPVGVPAWGGVVAEVRGGALCCGITADMMIDFINRDVRDNVLPVGAKIPNTEGDSFSATGRLPAIKAHVLDNKDKRSFEYNKPAFGECKCLKGCYYTVSRIDWASKLGVRPATGLTRCIWDNSTIIPMWEAGCSTTGLCTTGTCQPDSHVDTTYGFVCQGIPKSVTIRSFTSCSCQ